MKGRHRYSMNHAHIFDIILCDFPGETMGHRTRHESIILSIA